MMIGILDGEYEHRVAATTLTNGPIGDSARLMTIYFVYSSSDSATFTRNRALLISLLKKFSFKEFDSNFPLMHSVVETVRAVRVSGSIHRTRT